MTKKQRQKLIEAKAAKTEGNEYIKWPKCYKAESDHPYALCVGNGKERCNHCDLYTDLPSPYDYD